MTVEELLDRLLAPNEGIELTVYRWHENIYVTSETVDVNQPPLVWTGETWEQVIANVEKWPGGMPEDELDMP